MKTWFRDLFEGEQDRTPEKYRLLFAGEMGRAVLADILADLGVALDLDSHDPASNALRNYAETRLRSKVGNHNYLGALRVLLGDEELTP